jgi:hypothetical protein
LCRNSKVDERERGLVDPRDVDSDRAVFVLTDQSTFASDANETRGRLKIDQLSIPRKHSAPLPPGVGTIRKLSPNHVCRILGALVFPEPKDSPSRSSQLLNRIFVPSSVGTEL